MTKIILAYCIENQFVAAKIASVLSSKTDIEKVIFDSDNGIALLQKHTQNNSARILLLVSDNFLKTENCMNNALHILQDLGNQKRLMPIITEGVYSKDGNSHFYNVPTSFDRVSNVIQYMNYWQDKYLELRRVKPTSDEDFEFSERIRAVRTISSEIGELLRYLRAMEYFTYDQFEDSNFVILFRALGINMPEGLAEASKKVGVSHNAFPNDSIDNHIKNGENGTYQQPFIQVKKPPIVEETVANIDNSHFTLDALIDDIKKNEKPSMDFVENNGGSNFHQIIDEVVNEDSIIADKMSESPEESGKDEIQNIFNEDSNESSENDLKSLFDDVPATPPDAELHGANRAHQYFNSNSVNSNTDGFSPVTEIKLEDVQEEENIKNEVSRIFNEVEDTETVFEFENMPQSVDNLQKDSLEQSITNETPIVEVAAQLNGNDEIVIPMIHDKPLEETKSNVAEAKAALSKDPLDNELRYKYASELVQENRYHDTIEQLEILIENDRTHVEAYILLAYAAEQSGDYLLSLSCLEKVTLIKPTYPGIFYKLGMLLNEHFKSQKRKALHYFKEAVAHDSQNADAYFQLGKIELEQSPDLNKPIEYFQKAVTHNPQHAAAAYELAKAYYEIGNKEQAAAFYLQAHESNPILKTKINDDIFKYEVPIPEPLIKPVNDNGMTALITGATSGIGRATAEIFAKNGYRLILTGRREDRLSEIKEHFEKEFNNKNQVLNFDVRHLDSVKKAVDSIGEEWKNVDILINNAGLASGMSPIHEGDINDWELMIDTNIKGLLYMTRAIAPQMVARRKGHIINISSIAGKEIYPMGNVYIASKHAVDALTRAARVDLHKYNIRVSQVSPGAVEETEFSLVRFHGDAEKAKIYEEFQPLKASDVAESIYFIVSRPEYVNIQDITLMGTQQAGANWYDKSGRKDRIVKSEE